MVCLTVLYLRYSAPDLKRPFRTPFFPATPVLGALMCLFLLMSLMANGQTRNFFLVYLVGGLLAYFLYGFRHSRLGRGEIVLGAEPALDHPQKLDI
jgi:APA family basic amino acid/polyamine antiporter